MSGLVLGDGVGDVRVPGTGQLGVQDRPGDLQHASLGHPHQGVGHQPGAPVTLQAGGQQEKADWNVSNAALMETDLPGKRKDQGEYSGISYTFYPGCLLGEMVEDPSAVSLRPNSQPAELTLSSNS